MQDDYHTIIELVNSLRPMPLVYSGCQTVLASRLPANNMYVSINEKDGFRFPFYKDFFEPLDPLSIYPKEGLTAYVLESKARYWMSRDPQPPAKFIAVGPSPQDWLGVPLVSRNGNAIGVLAVQTYEQGILYADEDLEFLEYTADVLSLAIQLSNQDRDIAIRRIAALVDDTVDIHDLYASIHEIMQTVIPASAKNIIIARIDEGAGLFRPVYWKDEKDDFDTIIWPLEHGFSGYIYRVTRSSYIHEAGTTPMPSSVIPLGGCPPSHWLGAPLYSGTSMIGIVIIQSYDPDEIITKEDEYTLKGICPNIATAIGQTELFSQMHRS